MPSSDDKDAGLFVDSDSLHTATDEYMTTDPEKEAWNGDQSFVVNRIVAEKWDTDKQQTLYLTQWRNWKESDSTWEPSENFESPETIERWKVRKAEEADGRRRPYDLERFERLLHKRAVRRAQRGRQLLTPQCSASSDSDVETLDNMPLIKRRKLVHDEKRLRRSSSASSTGGDTDRDRSAPLMGRKGRTIKVKKSSGKTMRPLRRFDDFDDEAEPAGPALDPVLALQKTKAAAAGLHLTKALTLETKPRAGQAKQTVRPGTETRPAVNFRHGPAFRSPASSGPAFRSPASSAPAKKAPRMLIQPPQSGRPRGMTPIPAPTATSSAMFRSLGQQNRVNRARNNYEAPPQPGGVNLLAKPSAGPGPHRVTTLEVLDSSEDPVPTSEHPASRVTHTSRTPLASNEKSTFEKGDRSNVLGPDPNPGGIPPLSTYRNADQDEARSRSAVTTKHRNADRDEARSRSAGTTTHRNADRDEAKSRIAVATTSSSRFARDDPRISKTAERRDTQPVFPARHASRPMGRVDGDVGPRASQSALTRIDRLEHDHPTQRHRPSYIGSYRSDHPERYREGYCEKYREGYPEKHRGGYSEKYRKGYREGYSEKYREGYREGYPEGCPGGYPEKHRESYREGYREQYREGYREGYREQYREGYREKRRQGYRESYPEGYRGGYREDYPERYREGYRESYPESYRRASVL